MAVVVVESPAKAKTINKYLGPGYTVLASYGHVRDLPPKDGSVDPDHDFEMKWEVAPDSQKHNRAIAEYGGAGNADHARQLGTQVLDDHLAVAFEFIDLQRHALTA